MLPLSLGPFSCFWLFVCLIRAKNFTQIDCFFVLSSFYTDTARLLMDGIILISYFRYFSTSYDCPQKKEGVVWVQRVCGRKMTCCIWCHIKYDDDDDKKVLEEECEEGHTAVSDRWTQNINLWK